MSTAPTQSTGRRRQPIEVRRVDVSKLFDKLPPHALEAECALLGSLILDWRVCGEVVQIIKGADDLYKPAHAAIYETLVELYDQVQSIDMVQLKQKLDDKGQLEQVGGLDYLIELAESVPSAASAVYYANIVREKAALRRLIESAGQILDDCYNSSEPVGELLDKAERAIFEIAESKSSTEAAELGDLLQETYDKLQSDEGMRTGLETGFLELDEVTNGLQPGEMIIIAARPSMGKCLSADAQIVLGDGRVATIEELYHAREAELLTLGDDLRFTLTRASAFVDDGVKPVFRVTTRLGRTIKTTLTHPFLTLQGWRKLGDLKPGQRIAAPRRIDVFGSRRIGEHRAKLLGYLLGDGGLTNACPRFTSGSAALRDDFTNAVTQFGGLRVSEGDSGGTRTMTLTVAADPAATSQARDRFAVDLCAAVERSGLTRRAVAAACGVSPASITHWCQGHTVPDDASCSRLIAALGVHGEALVAGGIATAQKNTPNALTRWLGGLGLWGREAKAKFVPGVVFTLARDELAVFLNRLFATDGWATVLASGQSQLGFASVSERLARQVQHLLLRFGVVASLRRRSVAYRGARRPAFQLDVTDADSIRAFIDQIGMFGKEAACERVLTALDGRRYQTNRDLIPPDVWDLIDEERGGESWASVAGRMGFGPGHNLHVGTRALSRDRLWRFAQVMDSERLRRLAQSDVYWDEIVTIEYVGDEQVYDLTIPHTHNFVANDLCVHNTALALNMAEHMAATTKVPCAVFSLEMSRQQLAQRLLCSRSGVDSHKLRRNMLTQDDFGKLALTVGELSEAPLFIDDTPGLTLLGLRAKARRLAARHDIKAVFIDYLQLMSAPGSESRQQEVSNLSRGIKALARELSVPVICLSQLNRAAEQREGHRPRMSDLRESGSIEQDADVVMMLHRESYFHRGEEEWAIENPDRVNEAELIIAKQRNGPTGTVKLHFDGSTTRFKNLATHTPGGY